MVKGLAGLIILSLVGIAVFFTFRTDKLADKQFTIGTKKFSIMVPKNHISKSSDNAFISAGGGKILSVALNLLNRKSSKTITCSDLKAQTAFYVFNKYFSAEAEICKSEFKEKNVDMVFLDTPNFLDEEYRYQLAVGTYAEYLNTVKGEDDVRKIFESFKILE